MEYLREGPWENSGYEAMKRALKLWIEKFFKIRRVFQETIFVELCQNNML